MSARLFAARAGAAALSLAGGITLLSLAKPPGLPLDPTVNCVVPVAQSSDSVAWQLARPAHTEVLAEIDALGVDCLPPETLDEPFVEALEVLPAEVEPLEVMPAEVECLEVMPWQASQQGAALAPVVGWAEDHCVAGGSALPVPPPACPHLRRQAAARAPAAPLPASAVVGSVLENLARLKEAELLYGKAEALRQDGDIARASHLYRRIHEICPGSRLDQLASARKVELARRAADASAAEEAEMPPVTERQATQVRETLEAGRKALLADSVAEARRLARKAIALDPDCVDAYALFIRASLPGDGIIVIGVDGVQVLPVPSERRPKMPKPAEPLKVLPHEDDTEVVEPLEVLPRELPVDGKTSGGEEQESLEEAKSQTAPWEVQVAELLESSQRSYAAGCYAEAADLGRKALDLDPSCAAARTLVARAQTMTRRTSEGVKKQKLQRLMQRFQSDSSAEPPLCESQSDTTCLEPPLLPQVDGKVVEALHQVLCGTDNSAAERTIHVEGAEEQEEPAPSQPGPLPGAPELGPLYFLPADGDFVLMDDGELDPRRQHPQVSFRRMREIVKQVWPVVTQGTCIDVDLNGRRVRYQGQHLELQAHANSLGRLTVALAWRRPQSPDLHALQQEWNAQALAWIESVSANGGDH